MSRDRGSARQEVVTDAAMNRRNEIAAEAAKLFDAVGVDRVSMTQIADHVGLAKPSLYHYFRSKEEILYVIHATLFTQMTQSLEKRLAETDDARELLKGVFQDQLGTLVTHPGHIRVFFEHFRSLSPEFRGEVRDAQRRYESMVQEIFRRGRAQGVFRDVEPRLAALGLFGMVNWAHYWYSAKGDFTPTEVADQFYSMFLSGVESS